MHDLCSAFDIINRNSFIIQRNIALNISGKKKDILLNLSDGSTQYVCIDFFDIDPVNQDLPFLNVKISSDQI